MQHDEVSRCRRRTVQSPPGDWHADLASLRSHAPTARGAFPLSGVPLSNMQTATCLFKELLAPRAYLSVSDADGETTMALLQLHIQVATLRSPHGASRPWLSRLKLVPASLDSGPSLQTAERLAGLRSAGFPSQ